MSLGVVRLQSADDIACLIDVTLVSRRYARAGSAGEWRRLAKALPTCAAFRTGQMRTIRNSGFSNRKSSIIDGGNGVIFIGLLKLDWLAYLGGLLAAAGLAGVVYCLLAALRIRGSAASDAEMRHRLGKLIPINLAAVMTAIVGIVVAAAGLIL